MSIRSELTRKFLTFSLLFLLAACSNPFRKEPPLPLGNVSVVGILPILVDAESVIDHPSRDEVVQLLRRKSSGKEDLLVQAVGKTDRFFDVRAVSGVPEQFFGWLLEGGEWTGPPENPTRNYRFRPEVVRQLADGVAADALLVVVLQGVKRPAKQWDRTGLHYLEADFNLIQATGILVNKEGRILWQKVVPREQPFLFVQYPDFDAAYYNRSAQVPLRFLTLSGLDQTLTEGKRTLFAIGDANNPYRLLAKEVSEELKSLNFSEVKGEKGN